LRSPARWRTTPPRPRRTPSRNCRSRRSRFCTGRRAPNKRCMRARRTRTHRRADGRRLLDGGAVKRAAGALAGRLVDVCRTDGKDAEALATGTRGTGRRDAVARRVADRATADGISAGQLDALDLRRGARSVIAIMPPRRMKPWRLLTCSSRCCEQRSSRSFTASMSSAGSVRAWKLRG
jgi:hypothetical protein